MRRLHMPKQLVGVLSLALAPVILALPLRADETQSGRLTSTQAVLERYEEALGGVEAIKKVQSETAHGEIERTGMSGKATFVSYAKPFKSLFKVTRPDGEQVTSGFDGTVSWTITSKGASIDQGTPLESVRRDADLQYALHQYSRYSFSG